MASNEDWNLTAGSCARMLDPDALADSFTDYKPVIQFLSIKQFSATGPPRYRVVVSDGVHFLQAMLATQLNDMVTEDQIVKHTIARLNKFSVNNIQGKRLVVILSLDILGNAEGKIGEPELYEGNDKPVSTATTPANTMSKPASTSIARQTKPSGTTSGPPPKNISPSKKPHNICPIESLSPYQSNWTLKARITQKSDVRTWSNQRGEGKLFSVVLMDETGEIKATGFNTVVDQLYDKLQEGKVYYITKGRVNLAKKQFSTLSNEYEISLEAATEVTECEDVTNVPEIKFNFVKLNELEGQQKDAIIDVIGVLHNKGDLSSIVSKATNKTVEKLDIELVDDTEYSVRMTLWGKQAKEFRHELGKHPVLAFRGVKVGDYQGKTLSMFSNSTMHPEPDFADSHKLRGWYDAAVERTVFKPQGSGSFTAGAAGGSLNRNELKLVGDVRESDLGSGDRVDYFSIRATVINIKAENIVYPACPSATCNKKVVESGDGWRCEKCSTNYDKPDYRYLMSLCVADHTGQLWLQAFNDVGQQLMGLSANDARRLQEDERLQGSNAFTDLVNRASCKTWNFSCRAKSDTYNEQTRVKYGVSKVFEPDFRAEGLALLETLKQFK